MWKIPSSTWQRIFAEQEKKQKREAEAADAAEKERVAANAAQGLDANGKPIRPDTASVVDPATGLLKEQYQIKAGPDITIDQRGIEAIRARALANPGESAWAKMALDRQKLEEGQAAEKSRQSGLTQAAQGYADMAMRGGVSGGARERMTNMNMRQAMTQAQQVGRQGQLDRMNIGLQDEQQRMSSLKDLVQADNINANMADMNRKYRTMVDQYNSTGSLTGVDKDNQNTLAKYKEMMAAWGAEKTADAQRAAAGGGGKK